MANNTEVNLQYWVPASFKEQVEETAIQSGFTPKEYVITLLKLAVNGEIKLRARQPEFEQVGYSHGN